MCKITEKGYELMSGKVIPHSGANLENLTKEEMIELYDTPMNAFEGISIRKNIHGLRQDMQNILNTMTTTLDEMKSHSIGCPLNPNKINEMIIIGIEDYNKKNIYTLVDTIVKNIVKGSIIDTASIIKAMLIIISGFSLIGFIVYLIIGIYK